MRKPVILITGAEGEIGHGLVTRLASSGSPIITLDVSQLDASLAPLVEREFTGSVTDTNVLDRLLAQFEVDRVFHLARCCRRDPNSRRWRRITSTSKGRSICSS